MKKLREYWSLIAALVLALTAVFVWIHRRVIWGKVTGKPMERECARKHRKCRIKRKK